MIELIIHSKYDRMLDAVNSCTDNSIAVNNRVFTSNIDEIKEVIAITDKLATIEIIREF